MSTNKTLEQWFDDALFKRAEIYISVLNESANWIKQKKKRYGGECDQTISHEIPQFSFEFHPHFM